MKHTPLTSLDDVIMNRKIHINAFSETAKFPNFTTVLRKGTTRHLTVLKVAI